MCYTINAKATIKDLKEKYDATFENEEEHQIYHSVSGFAHPALPILTVENPRLFTFVKWGMIPFWTQDSEKAKLFSNNNLNAKSETIFEKPSFNKVIKRKRCIIPVTGFFEWRDINKIKYPYYIFLKNEHVFSLGGIYDSWKDNRTGLKVNTFSIITTEANPLMAKIHNLKLRMPLILSDENADAWLNDECSENVLKSLMVPFDDSKMEAHTISKRITSRTENPNAPETTAQFEYPELAFYE